MELSSRICALSASHLTDGQIDRVADNAQILVVPWKRKRGLLHIFGVGSIFGKHLAILGPHALREATDTIHFRRKRPVPSAPIGRYRESHNDNFVDVRHFEIGSLFFRLSVGESIYSIIVPSEILSSKLKIFN